MRSTGRWPPSAGMGLWIHEPTQASASKFSAPGAGSRQTMYSTALMRSSMPTTACPGAPLTLVFPWIFLLKMAFGIPAASCRVLAGIPDRSMRSRTTPTGTPWRSRRTRSRSAAFRNAVRNARTSRPLAPVSNATAFRERSVPLSIASRSADCLPGFGGFRTPPSLVVISRFLVGLRWSKCRPIV